MLHGQKAVFMTMLVICVARLGPKTTGPKVASRFFEKFDLISILTVCPLTDRTPLMPNTAVLANQLIHTAQRVTVTLGTNVTKRAKEILRLTCRENMG